MLVEAASDFSKFYISISIITSVTILFHWHLEEICTLVIAEVFAEDSGCFTCTASNKYGTVSSIAQLDVRGKGSLHVTQFRL